MHFTIRYISKQIQQIHHVYRLSSNTGPWRIFDFETLTCGAYKRMTLISKPENYSDEIPTLSNFLFANDNKSLPL